VTMLSGVEIASNPRRSRKEADVVAATDGDPGVLTCLGSASSVWARRRPLVLRWSGSWTSMKALRTRMHRGTSDKRVRPRAAIEASFAILP